jgi:SAM-dependent methyltransferase
VIYETVYTTEQLSLRPGTPYDATMIELRLSLLEQFGKGKDVLDLCCGTGSYLLPVARSLKRCFGVDFSRKMLAECSARAARDSLEHVAIAAGDATAIPMRDRALDAVVSYCSLYYVEDLAAAVREIARVLRPGGVAVLELGNLWSLNTWVARVQARDHAGAVPRLVSLPRMRKILSSARLEVIEWRAFQLLPMYGAPRALFFLRPILSASWKRILGLRLAGRMLDEWVSRSWPLRYLAFRHLFVVKRACAASY